MIKKIRHSIYYTKIQKWIGTNHVKLYYKHNNLNIEIDILRLAGIEDACYYHEYLPKDLICFFGDFLVKSVALKDKISDDIDSESIETYIALMTNATGFK